VTISTAGVKVVLRGLTINGMGGTNGIYMDNGASLTVDHCVVSNFPGGRGLYVGTAAQVAVLDSLMTGSSDGAFFLNGATATVSRSRFLANSNMGLRADQGGAGTTTISVIQSEASGNHDRGVYAYAHAGGALRLDIRDSVLNGNADGVFAISGSGTLQVSVSSSLVSGNIFNGMAVDGTGATLTAGGNTVTSNGYGLNQGSSGVFESAGDNIVRGNTTASAGSITWVGTM
jgi:hypothetical protein